MNKHLRILVLVHEQLVPPESMDGLTDEELEPVKTEYDVTATLNHMGHTARPLGVGSDLGVINKAVDEFKPHIAFNLLEEFAGVGVFDAHVASYLEMLGLPYTGCNPRGLMLAHNKAISKMICRYHRIAVPRFHVFQLGHRVRRPKRLAFPLFVKSLTEEGSIGISQASVVRDDEQLAERVDFIHRTVKTDAIADQYIYGREFYIGVLGNQRLQTFPLWELVFNNLRDDAPKIATARIKWDNKYRRQIGIDTGPAKDVPEAVRDEAARLAKRAYRSLQLSGYA
ncbi:MAG: D-alanine--D-alanine ligase, partial [Planctomycetota bacterium]